MRLALLAAGLMVIIAVGIFIGLTGFQQYAFQNSRSMAGSVVCAPDSPVTAPGRTVVFSISGLPGGTTAHWSAPEGRSEVVPPDKLSVLFGQRGTKTVSVFYQIDNSWERTDCSVSVQ